MKKALCSYHTQLTEPWTNLEVIVYIVSQPQLTQAFHAQTLPSPCRLRSLSLRRRGAFAAKDDKPSGVVATPANEQAPHEVNGSP